jgi:acyl-coenzyme A thioesterase PaaI-like protein
MSDGAPESLVSVEGSETRGAGSPDGVESEGAPDSVERRRRYFVDMFHVTPFAKTTGLRLHYDDHGSAVLTLEYNQGLNHPLGFIFGGMLSAMMDLVGHLTVAAHYEHWVATLEYSTRILEQTKEVSLIARGVMRKRGRTAAFADMEVHTADKHRLVSTGSAVFHVTPRPVTYKQLRDLEVVARGMNPARCVY